MPGLLLAPVLGAARVVGVAVGFGAQSLIKDYFNGTACGVFLLLRARTFAVVLGLTLLSYADTLFLFASGRLTLNAPPLVRAGATYTDPMPQALVLTAIAIGFGMTAYVVVLALRARAEWGSDHVDAREEEA